MKYSFSSIFKKLLNRYTFSVLFSLFLIIIGYFTNNWSVWTNEPQWIYTIIHRLNMWDSNNSKQTKVLFVNTSNDKQLLTIYDNYIPEPMDTCGYQDVVDRKILLHFLKLLKEAGNYGYVVIDISFTDKDYMHPQIDTALVNFIKNMPRCVVPIDSTNQKLLGGLETKAAKGIYKFTNFDTNFLRYEYFDTIPSIPLHVYNEMQKAKAKGHNTDTVYTIHNNKCRFFTQYKEGKRFCQNSIFLKFSKEYPPKVSIPQGTFQTGKKDLGADYYYPIVNKVLTKEEIVENLTDELEDSAIVIIGDFDKYDKHMTYAGEQSGMVIIYEAINALNNGLHYVNKFHYLLLFVFYILITLFSVRKNSINVLPERFKQFKPYLKSLLFLIDMISLNIILILAAFIEARYFQTTTNFILETSTLNFIRFYIKYKNFVIQ